MEHEEWKDIPGFESYYQVSNFGNVKSLSRQVSKYEYRLGKILKPKLVKNIYKVGLTKKTDGKRRDYRIDNLVASTFVKGYTEGDVVIHIDNNQTNNRADNLKWINISDYTTYTENDSFANEIWKDVRGYECEYQVSNFGRIRSLPRIYGRKVLRGDLLKPYLTNNGYARICLKGRNFFVHRLVALTFCEGYANGLVVNHKDENKANNRADNLEWVTSEYNKFYGTAMDRAKKKIQYKTEENRREREYWKKERKRVILSKHQREVFICGKNEIWADIESFEGLYQISSWGRVKSLPKPHPSVRGGFYKTREKILTPRKHSNGYLNVQLSKAGVKKNYYIHRLVAMAFLKNDHPKEYTDINHINEDKTDNHVSNLEWCTHVYNTIWGTRNKRAVAHRPPMEETQQKKNKLEVYGAEKPVMCIDDEGCIVAEYKSIQMASRITGNSTAKICQCCKGKRNKTGGYYWQYIIK